jgi:hypothetical protein
MFNRISQFIAALLVTATAGCGPNGSTPGSSGNTPQFRKTEEGKADTSAEAVILNFEFDAELLTDYVRPDTAKNVIEDQLLFTIGQLNGQRSVGRIDRLELSNIQIQELSRRQSSVTYHAVMPVAWGSKTDIPTEYELVVPRDMGLGAQSAFVEKYHESCVDIPSHTVDSSNMFYFYRPLVPTCQLAPEDVVRAKAASTISSTNTTGKFPEYHKVWEDNALRVVAVFGKYETGSNSSLDPGVSAYAAFVMSVGVWLSEFNVTTHPPYLPPTVGQETPDAQFDATLLDGKTVQINALLVDKVAEASDAFYARYEALSSSADFIAYNGHSGLGQNVRALAAKGKWVPGQYVMIFMNGCDSFAFVDGSLAQTRALVNPDDPTGTKYMDIMTNAMPSLFASDAAATVAVMRALTSYDAPVTYEKIFESIDSSQVVIVTGEEDNVYVPGYPNSGQPAQQWAGINETGTVTPGEEKRWETPALAPGKYEIAMTGSGDADLYVRLGSDPTPSQYDCRPYLSGSNETCIVELPSTTAVHVLVRGYRLASDYHLVASPL